MKKLLFLIVAIVAFGLIVSGCLPVVPPTEQIEPNSLTRNGTNYYVSDTSGNDTTGDGTSGNPWATITYAISQAASTGDTIIVAAGTYHNDISSGHWVGGTWVWDTKIDKSVTLLGAQFGNDPVGSTDRGGESILIRDDGLPYSITAPNVVIDGFMNGDPLITNSGGRFIIGPDADNVIIRNCIIQNTPNGSSGHGVCVYPGATGANISNNTFSNTAWEAIRCDGNAVIFNNTIKDIPTNKGIYLGASSSAIVNDNVISTTYYEGIQACAPAAITDNEISGCYKGIQVRDSASGSTISGNVISDTTYEGIQALVSAAITDNEISGCYHGIQIRDSATGTNIDGNDIHDNTYHGLEILNDNFITTITNNTFTNNGYTGIKVGGGSEGSGISIHHNCFNGNVYFGVESNTANSNVNAVNNWWGNSSGPGGVGTGIGDAVSSMVDYNPWLTELAYSGVTTFANTGDVILQVTLHNSDNGAEGGEVNFYIDGILHDTSVTGVNGIAELNIGTMSVGVYEIRAVSDCMETSAFIAVYDPLGGFVTGGGWIDSPEEAYADNPSLTGKATFGFVSKYKKGQSTPTGNTEFQFKAGNLNFHSDSYDWLVIAGAKAMYKGTGTINGAGNYGFMISAIDEKLTPSTDVDLFRIKIWDKGTGIVIYDNQNGDDDNGDATTELGGGQIVIHKAK